MQKSLSVLMAQINPNVGAIEKNAEQIMQIIRANQDSHDIIIFPELVLTGYPPEDLLFRKELFERVRHALDTIISITGDCHVVLGHPTRENGQCYNTASVLFNTQLMMQYHKQHLPNYGIFDEKRYFEPGSPNPCILTINDFKVGLCICEDLWQPGPVEQIAQAGADILISINASPFDENKYEARESILRRHASLGLTIIYVNQCGGQDSLVFDGQSLVMNTHGIIGARAQAFQEHLQTVALSHHSDAIHIQGVITPLLNRDALIYQALICGLRDYVEKNHFPGVLLGLSGGIDSALTLAIAVDALGPDRVHAILLPSRHTAKMSIEDALTQAKTMRVQHTTLPIEPTFKTLLETLSPVFNDCPPGATEENLQARIRGVLLMALSNKTGNMLLTTSNKSETAVGYATLYGDMCGGFGVLKDVLKTRVYTLANYRNAISSVIPQRVIERPPSAELAPNQIDQDSLPDYAILDAIIEAYMIEQLGRDEIIHKGFCADDVDHIIKLIKRNEYKRQQSAPGVKISKHAFDRDWRYPITSG